VECWQEHNTKGDEEETKEGFKEHETRDED